MLSAWAERRQDRKRAEREQLAHAFTGAVAEAGFFGAEAAMDAIHAKLQRQHAAGEHDVVIALDCPLCRSHGVPAEGPRIAVAA